jgi:ABC-type glycerol-3-phosphate transport system substrate-binding protein
MSSKKIIQFSIIILSLVIIAEGMIYFENYRALKNGAKPTGPTEVTLEFWGLWDNSDSWQEIIRRFENETHIWNGQEVKVKIVYTKQDIASYEEKINQGYNENNSPSIFIVNNYWLEDYVKRLEPLSGNFALVKEYELLDYAELADIFPFYTIQDVEYGNNEMFALPIYSDSLALYYNKDLFAKAGITNPPATWDELKKDIKKLTISDRKNNIEQAGIALGSGQNINRSCDIVSLLMFQGGSKIINNQKEIDINKKIAFNTPQGIQEREPGLTAIQFYMEFSDPNKDIYTWNNDMENSVKSFAEGKTAMMFGYAYQKANLLAMNPDLNYGIAPAPQIPKSAVINISNVWSPVVSNQQSCSITNQNNKTNIDCAQIAWSFLSFANEKENITEYLNKTGKASARIDIAKEQSQRDDTISAFAKQADSARSYNKFDDKIETILTTMLDEIYKDRDNWKDKVNNAVTQIEELKK